MYTEQQQGVWRELSLSIYEETRINWLGWRLGADCFVWCPWLILCALSSLIFGEDKLIEVVVSVYCAMRRWDNAVVLDEG